VDKATRVQVLYCRQNLTENCSAHRFGEALGSLNEIEELTLLSILRHGEILLLNYTLIAAVKCDDIILTRSEKCENVRVVEVLRAWNDIV